MTPVEYNVRDFGAKGDGVTDDSTAFQTAIDEAFTAGGGIVSVPGAPKGWVLAKPLLVRPNVTLKGFHAGPTDAHFLAHNDANAASNRQDPLPPVAGGLLIKQNRYPAITLAHNSGIQGLTFAYPDQVPYTSLPIKVYPPTLQLRGVNRGDTVPGIPRTHGIREDGPISGRSVTIRDIGAINAYHILDITGDFPINYQMAQITIDGLWGYPLSVGVNIQNSLDTIMLHNVQFRPTFFHAACSEISKSSIGFSIGKSDGCVVSDVLVFGLGIGILHRTVDKSYPAFSIRVSNANIEAMLPVWMDSMSVDDQVQYVNSFLFHTPFGFQPAASDIYSREGHTLFPDIKYTPSDIAVLRISNRHEKDTFQSYARFVGCGFHAQNAGPICRIEGNRLVRVMMSSSHMVYFRDAVLKADSGARVLGIITDNDIMLHSTNLSSGAPDNPDTHLVDITKAGAGTHVIFSNNMLHGVRPGLVDELSQSKEITANGNAAL